MESGQDDADEKSWRLGEVVTTWWRQSPTLEAGGLILISSSPHLREADRSRMPPASAQPHSAPFSSFWDPISHSGVGSGFRDSV